MGWYNTSWKYRKKITVPSSKVISDLTDFPISVKLVHFPIDFWNNVINGGDDIRVTKSDGTTEVPREIVSCNTSTKTGELHFKATGTLSSSSDNIFYVYYGNSGASGYGVTDTYGRNNVWTADFEIVAHFEEDPDAASFVNSTGGPSGTYTNTSGLADYSEANSKWGKGCDFSGTSPVGHVAMNTITENDRNYAFSAFVNFASTSGAQAFFEYSSTGSTVGGRRVGAMYNAGKVNWNHNNYDGMVEPTTTISTNTWYHFSVNSAEEDSTNATVNAWVNGATKTTKTSYESINTDGTLCKIGCNRTVGEPFNGRMDELRYYKAAKSDDWMTTESDNLRNPETFYTVGSTEHESATSNWYNVSWTKRIKVDIDPAKVPSGLTDFPLYVDLSLLPTEFFTSVKSAGEDIRITTADGVTELPLEVVAISTGGETGEVHTKYPYLNGTGTDAIYIYFGNSGASAYGVSDTYGRNNVWTGYERVFHLNTTPTGSLIDSTGSGNDLTSSGTMTSGDLVDCKIGKGIDFDGSNDYLYGSDSGLPAGTTARTLSMWLNHNSGDSISWDGFCGYGVKGSKQAWYPGYNNAGTDILVGTNGGNSTDTTFTLSNDVWNHLVVKSSSTSIACIKNGSTKETLTAASGYSTVLAGASGFQIAWNWGSQYFGGLIDEVRVASSELSDDWILTEYNNQNASNTFYPTVSSVESTNTAPTLSSTTPTDNATGVAIGANLVANFSEDIQKGTGYITIVDDDMMMTFEAIDVTSAQVTISGSQVTINPSSDFSYLTNYHVEIDNTAIEDLSSLAFAGISDSTTWNFTTEEEDLMPPNLSSTSPTTGATGVARNTNIVLTFDENIQKGTGNILIKKYSDDTTIESIDVTSGLVTISGTQATINPASDLPNATQVYVEIPYTAIEDLSGNQYMGTMIKDDIEFTTVDDTGPILVSSNPADGAVAIDPTTNIVLDFDENIAKGTGNITIKKYDDDTTVEAIDVTSGQVTVSSTQVTVNPSSDLDPNTHYYVLIDNTAIEDLASNAYAGISSKDTLDFTTLPVAIESLTPAEGSTANAVDTNLELDFNQDVVVGTGNVTISQRPNLKIGGDDFAGDVGEILVIKENISDADRQKIEGYLAWRWFGAANPLTSNHPYKYRGPAV